MRSLTPQQLMGNAFAAELREKLSDTKKCAR
jgi:hypothetical protein